jgi:acyl-CoA thioesterase I
MRSLALPGQCALFRSYGKPAGKVQSLAVASALRKALVAAGVLFCLVGTAFAQPATSVPLKIVALGDSLTAGLGLPVGEAFPAKLQQALKAKGIAAEIVNAGVSGDTATGGLERLDWSVPPDTDAVIVELGANDALRGIDPRITRAAIAEIVQQLRARGLPVLLAGMLAPPNMGKDYKVAFDQIFPDIAAAYGALYYPFFLQGVAADRGLNQPDGIHPNAAGVDVIVAQILPTVEQLVTWARKPRWQ